MAESDRDLFRAAFEALLQGDLKRRDELCARLEARMKAREKEDVALAIEAAPYFTKQ